MKLYGTTISERASKGQGGNKFIKTVLLMGSAENPEHIATMLANVVGDQVILQFWASNGLGLREIAPRTVLSIKGEKQKCGHLITTAIYKNEKLQGYQCNACGEMETKGNKQTGKVSDNPQSYHNDDNNWRD